MNRDNRWTMLFAGIGIGAAAGILFARCSGAELREAIQRRTGDAASLLKNQAETIVDRVGSAAETSCDKLATHLTKGKELARDLSKNAKDFIHSAAESGKATSDKVHEAAISHG